MPRLLRIHGVFSVAIRNASNKHKATSADIIHNYEEHLAKNYCPYPVVLTKGQGAYLFDVEGKKYLDFLTGYASVPLGHCHPKLVKVLCAQSKQLTHTSRAFYTKTLADYGMFLRDLFEYDKVLPLSTSSDGVETAVKLARKWGYKNKQIGVNQAKVLFPEKNFWGFSIAGISASTEPDVYNNYGPFVPCFDTVPFNDLNCLEEKLKDPNVVAYVLEPIQCEAGVEIPGPQYLKNVRELCTKHRVLMIVDESITGVGRCGCLLCSDIYRIRPDVLVLGRSLGGGIMPVSCVLSDREIMDNMEPGTHGSTFGGSPLGCKLSMTVLSTVLQDRLSENAKTMGQCLRSCLCELPRDVVTEVRGIGLLNGIVLKEGINPCSLCREIIRHGLLVSVTRNQVIRLLPPLTIREHQVKRAAQIIRHCIENSRGKYEDEVNQCEKEEANNISLWTKIKCYMTNQMADWRCKRLLAAEKMKKECQERSKEQ